MQVCSHYIYRTACHQYVAACHRPPILHWTIRLSIPMGWGAFTHNARLTRHQVSSRERRVILYIKSLCTGGASPPLGTDTITNFWSYCQQLFLSLSYLQLAFQYVEGAYHPLDRYLIRLSQKKVNNFFGLLPTFFDLYRLAAEWGGGRWQAGRRAGGDVITITIIDMNRNENSYHYY